MFSIAYSVKKSTFIEAPIEKVFSLVSDFYQWREWSPWVCQEPECPITFSGKKAEVGHSQAWDGKRIGRGKMAITAIDNNHQIDYDLNFIKPWKSFAKVSFEFEESGNGTTVTWSMDSTLPLFMFFMKKLMIGFIGGDYERGLSMLKELIEKGSVPSKSEVKGSVDREAFHYVGIQRECPIPEMGTLMAKDFEELGKKIEAGEMDKPDFSLSFYNKYDMAKGICNYTSGFAYKNSPNKKPEGLTTGEVEEHPALQTDHTGPYRYLGNAWSTAISYQRSEKKKLRKGIPMYEVYRTMPGEVDEKDMHTEIYVPFK